MMLAHRLSRRVRKWANKDIYRKLYEEHAALTRGNESIGDGDFDLIGRLELNLLRAEGLLPHHTLFDLGCGIGRMAVHAVPYLSAGAYVGADVAASLLTQAEKRVKAAGTPGGCKVSWQVQTSSAIPLPAGSVDMLCAFSVFTHLEHEDSYRYLVEARRVVRPGGKVVFSCLPLELPVARDFFLLQAGVEFDRRWAEVRNVATSRDMMNALAEMAGWRVERWYAGNELNIDDGEGGMRGLGQSSCVLVAPDNG
jgi:ubiquinone/menaquinone biosynthesis C-methylase UbiE